MEKATWEEIKALASDFKRTQAITLNQKLTERNCIDIIHYLCNNKQVSLYFTTDGKTFLTHEELEKEIYEELEISGGRIEITKLSSILDLDFHTVESTINKMTITDADIQLVMGNIVNSSYVRRVALKINEMAKDQGRVTILELTQEFLLPKIFIEKIISNNIGSIIEVHKDGEMLYTNNFIRRYSAMIRGYLTRSSKPVSITNLNQKFSISEKLIVGIITDLVGNKRILGKLDQNKSFFIPDIHLKNQKLYLQRFFEQNNYLDFSTMKEIGIQNAAKYVEIEFPDLKILSSCALGEGIIFQLEAAIQECEKNDSFFSCYQIIVPTIVNNQDLLTLVNNIIETNDKLVFIGNEFVVSKAFINNCVTCFDDIIKSKAEEFVKKNRKSVVNILTESSFHEISVEENVVKKEKISKFKSGGGLQGREIKVKSVKHKYLPDKKSANQKSTNKKSSQESTFSMSFLSEEECLEVLMKNFSTNEDVTDELLMEIFQLIEKQLNFNYKSQCRLSILQTSDTAKSKAEHQKLEATLSTMMIKIKLFHRGLVEITSESLRNELMKYNLRTICGDVVNCLFEYIAGENDFSWDSSNVTNEMKTKLINHVAHNLSVVMKNLYKSLKEDDSFDNFYSAFDAICEVLDFHPKKLDKKNEKHSIVELGAQYHSIIVSKCDRNEYIEPGELLLITTVLIFQKITGLPLHASGKFVPAILEFLKQKTASTKVGIDWEGLKEYQDYVIAAIKTQNATVEEREAVKQSHQDLHQRIIDFALNWKSIKTL